MGDRGGGNCGKQTYSADPPETEPDESVSERLLHTRSVDADPPPATVPRAVDFRLARPTTVVVSPVSQQKFCYDEYSPRRRATDEPLLDDNSPPPPTTVTSTPSGWRTWQQKIAFSKRMGQALSVSPDTNFAHTVTLDLSVVVDAPPRRISTISIAPAILAHAADDRRTVRWAKQLTASCFKLAKESEDWVLTALIAVGTAASAAWIEFVSEHLEGLKFGFCRGMLWLDRKFCCGSAAAVDIVHNRCHAAVHLTQLDFLSHSARQTLHHQVPTDPFRSYPRTWTGMSNSPSGVFSRVDPTVDQRASWIAWSSYFDDATGMPSFKPFVSAATYIFTGVGLACFAALLCKKIAPAAGGSGIPEIKTILGGFSLPRTLHPWTLCIKIVALAMTVASGLALGKEGPMVHVGGCWAETFSKITSKVWKRTPDAARKNALLSAGSAAGVSTAFGAPVGGVLFALEEVSTYFPPSTLYKTLFCAVVASLVLKKVNSSGSSNGTIFKLDAIAMQGRWSIVELIPFLLVAVVGGCIGAAFIRLNMAISHWRSRHKKQSTTCQGRVPIVSRILSNPVAEVFAVALIASIMNYWHPMLRESSISLMTNLFTRCGKDGIGSLDIFSLCKSVPADSDSDDAVRYEHNISVSMLISLTIALVLYFINALFTLGLALPAGLFVPCLTIGAITGRIIGLLTIRANESWKFMNCQDCIHPGIYSLLGAVALLAGVARMTVSLVVIAFEMTGGLGYIVPFMMVTLVSKWTAERIMEPSVYDVAIQLKKYPFLHLTPLKSDHAVAYGKRAGELMSRNVICISLAQKWTLRRVEMLVREYHYSYFPVVTDPHSKILKGTVLRRKLSERIKELRRQQSSAIERDVTVIFQNDCFIDSDSLDEDFNETNNHHHPHPLHQHHHRQGPQTIIDFSGLVDAVIVQVNPNISLTQVHHIFLQLGLSFLLFTENGALKGILTKKAFLSRLEALRSKTNI